MPPYIRFLQPQGAVRLSCRESQAHRRGRRSCWCCGHVRICKSHRVLLFVHARARSCPRAMPFHCTPNRAVAASLHGQRKYASACFFFLAICSWEQLGGRHKHQFLRLLTRPVLWWDVKRYDFVVSSPRLCTAEGHGPPWACSRQRCALCMCAVWLFQCSSFCMNAGQFVAGAHLRESFAGGALQHVPAWRAGHGRVSEKCGFAARGARPFCVPREPDAVSNPLNVRGTGARGA